MYKRIIEKLKDKKLAILGFGKEGKSTYNFIRRYLPNKEIDILDLNTISIEDNKVNIVSGIKYLDDLEKYDLIIKTPGISLKDIDTSKIIDKLTSQLELLLEVFRDNIIGITGTKGKSTTSTLLYETIHNQYKNSFLVGNIGKPVLDDIELYNKDTILVIEMSSHQLEYIKTSPHIAAILNLYEDHLDHDGNLKHYHNNKLNIFKYQKSNDYSIYADDNTYLHELINDKFKGIKYDIRFDNSKYNENSIRLDNNIICINGNKVYRDDKRNLLGNHNLKNIMFVITIIYILNLDLNKAEDTIKKFKGLKYRMEYIGKYHNIKFYNDTIATIPEATINAIDTIKDIDTLIIGGMNRGINYKDFIEYLNRSNITNIICMPETGLMIGKKLTKKVFYAETLEEAYEISINNTTINKSCLLSPAAASYNMYRNFEEKGQKFEEIVKNN